MVTHDPEVLRLMDEARSAFRAFCGPQRSRESAAAAYREFRSIADQLKPYGIRAVDIPGIRSDEHGHQGDTMNQDIFAAAPIPNLDGLSNVLQGYPRPTVMRCSHGVSSEGHCPSCAAHGPVGPREQFVAPYGQMTDRWIQAVREER